MVSNILGIRPHLAKAAGATCVYLYVKPKRRHPRLVSPMSAK